MTKDTKKDIDRINIPLFVLDYIILLPVTLLRLVLIYLSGSRYNIPGLKFIDIMMHASKPKFNKGKMTLDTEDTDLSTEIKNYVSKKDESIDDSEKKEDSDDSEDYIETYNN